MQRVSKAPLSLGAAIWGFAAAAGYARPQQEVPEAWLLLLIEEHADAEFYLRLFRASRGARDWVLVTSPKAQLYLRSGSGPWSRFLDAARQALSTRGAKPVRLRVEASLANAAVLVALPSTLKDGIGAGVIDLSVCYVGDAPYPLPPTAVSAFLWAAAPQLPNLATLTLTSIHCELPSLTLIPQLRALSFDQLQPDEAVCTSAAQYFTQITSLNVSYSAEADPSHIHPLLYGPSAPSSTLVQLTTNTCLSDELLSLLLDKTPVLDELTVGGCALTSDQFRDKQWLLKALRIDPTYDNSHVHKQSLEPLACLPQRKDGQLVITSTGTICLEVMVTSVEGIVPEVYERLPEFEFHHTHIMITPHHPLDSLEHPEALLTVLRQVTTVHVHGTATVTPSVQLCDWQWTEALARNAALLLPELHKFHFSIHNGLLTVGRLTALVQFRPERLSLLVDSLWLMSDGLADAAWGFDTLFVRSVVHVADLVRLPRPVRPCVVRCAELMLACNIMEVDVPRLLRWLHHVQWKGHVKSRTLTIRVDCPYEYTDEQAHVLLLTQLSILRAVRLCKEDMPTVHLVLEGWPLTSEVMSALQGLPQWPCALHIKDSQWPLEPDAYRTLAQYIPTSYYRWHLEASQVSLTQAEQVALGIIQHRESLTQPVARPVQVCVTDLRIASRLVQIEGECEHFEFVVGGFVYREPK